METLTTKKVSIVLPDNFENGCEGTHFGKIRGDVYAVWHQVCVYG